MSSENRKDLWIALAFLALAAALRVPRLGFPPEEIFDEVYHARTALQYLNHEALTEWVHPPTAKLLIALGIWAFHYNSWAWRLVPVLAGIAMAPTYYALARTTLPTRRAAVLATLVLSADGVYLVQSRVAMTNIFAVFFQVAAALFIVRGVLEERLGALDMLLAGVFLGLGLSTRWTSLWAWGFLGAVFFVVRAKRAASRHETAPFLACFLSFAALPVVLYACTRASFFSQGKPLAALAVLGVLYLGVIVVWAARATRREALLFLVSFLALPVGLYVLSYIPLLAQRNHFGTRAELKAAAIDLIGEQGRVWTYHATLNATHPYFSKWYTWPWLYRPTWYYFTQAGDYVRGIVAIGNPAIWWCLIPVTIWVLVRGVTRKDPAYLFAGFGFCALYLPWGISPRTLNYSHYIFEALPYGCLSLGLLLDLHWDQKNWRAKGYLVLIWVLFAFFYPFLTAIPIATPVFGGRWSIGLWAWFPTWI